MIDHLKRQSKRNSRHDSSNVSYIDDEVEIFGHRRTISKVALKNYPYAVPWVMDDAFSSCMLCLSTFNLTRWRHHCRVCGYLVCHNCSGMKVHLEVLREPEGSRICDSCINEAVPIQSNKYPHPDVIVATNRTASISTNGNRSRNESMNSNHENNVNTSMKEQVLEQDPSPSFVEGIIEPLPLMIVSHNISEFNNTTMTTSMVVQPSSPIMMENDTLVTVSSVHKRTISRNAIIRNTPSKHLCHISKFEEAAENGVWEVTSLTPASSVHSSAPSTGQNSDIATTGHKSATERKAAARLAKADASVSKAIRHFGIWEADDADDDDNSNMIDSKFTSQATTPTSKGRASITSYGHLSPSNEGDWDIPDENDNANRFVQYH